MVPSRVVDWTLVAAVTAAGGWVLGAAGVPSPYLFAALLAGLAVALAAPGRLDVPPRAFVAAQAVAGVAVGTYLQPSSLEALADDWLPVALVSAATLAASLAAGVLLARATAADEPTAALGMVAGGASGIVAMADDLGGDDRLVAFMQYARVLIIVLLTPMVAALLFDARGDTAPPDLAGPFLGTLAGWPFTVAAAVAGALLGRLVRLPSPTLLGPLILAAAVTLSGAGVQAPPLAFEAAFAVIGLQVGLRFTTETVRAVGRLLVPVLVAIAALLVACFGLAVVLAGTTAVTLLDAYLATTPGGLYAVLAVAFGSGADTTFVLAVQGLRLLVMVLLAPVAIRGLAALRARRMRARS